MAKRTRIWVWFGLAVLALLSFAGCSGDDSPDDEEAEKAVKAEAAIAGSFRGQSLGDESPRTSRSS